MIVVPAVDLRAGRCVRLLRGERGTETLYDDDPVAVARRWESEGAALLHVVDLDAAFGEPAQKDLVAAVIRAVGVPVQVGGGVRSYDDFLRLRAAGASRVVFGTVAIEAPEIVERALAADGGAVVVGVDVKEGRVAVRGWTERSNLDPAELGRLWAGSGVERFVYTEVARDGAMEGVDAEATERFVRATERRVVASGGIGSLHHLRALRPLGVEGVIVGRALYERAFTLAQARRAVGE